MTEGKPGIMLYYKTVKALADLDDRQFGRLVRDMLDYGSSGKEPRLEGTLAAVWPFLREKIDDDDERYAKRKARGQKAANRRWENARNAEGKDRTEWMAQYVRRNNA